ncbi:TetR family transcriptional regulator [Bacillus sp. PS06]|nr:TetR/AcrR family transcriptional regulator [Bacillus sp. PS06]MBD8067636.1 TetR family transcriptional regulator [Bacillus sp. PS06]
MPKITFHNLPDDKKQKLIQAAKKEFSRVPFYEASISNIVKQAKIPRGSFYQYFEDKEDAYYFLISEFVFDLNNQFVTILKKHQGDLFETMIEVFTLIIEEEENFYLLRNIFLNMTYKVEDKFSGIFRDHHSASRSFQEISSYINKDTLNINEEKELYYVIQIISSVTFRNFVERFAKDLSNEEALNNYRMEINMLKQGLARNKS